MPDPTRLDRPDQEPPGLPRSLVETGELLVRPDPAGCRILAAELTCDAAIYANLAALQRAAGHPEGAALREAVSRTREELGAALTALSALLAVRAQRPGDRKLLRLQETQEATCREALRAAVLATRTHQASRAPDRRRTQPAPAPDLATALKQHREECHAR